ncbi:hypothetical protein ABB37_01593 [Leptomonas pyrrhocoris]|uniref:Uncharacterized protein n=1 Tax=Leptomonas pyrrhocoris TaxID=157538 RepID=A0A0N1J5C3_LEPPY|nr:hypothetical protein ABB37_01593 [Leptomonas pyrrhocoris]KPA85241.1 hypothetical protein ABB37_01593 [Leptomonas pyrrhocoris]|eukprot:XP_015663680.1 hypothetical protein ABB37_01593 [Leptomonas pyrrhocoris]
MHNILLQRSSILNGREPLPPRRAPVYCRHLSDVELHKNSTELSLHAIWSRWREGRYNELTEELVRVGDLIQSKEEIKFSSEFLAFGGIDVYCFILCDPFTPLNFLKDRPTGHQRYSAFSERRLQRSVETILGIYSEIMLQLTDLLANQNDLGWALYDRCPGLFYRLIEFLEDSTLWTSATGLLEHALSCVGPVIEISKTPSLVKVLRGASLSALAAFCRFLALLILPGLAQGQNPIAARRLHYPESVVVLRQVQRVVDSNVLWLIGEEGLVGSLIRLCELRPSGLRVQQGGRSMMMPPAVATTMTLDANGNITTGERGGPENAMADAADSETAWEDDEADEEGEEEDGAWQDTEGSGASGASDGTADFLVDGSSLPTFFAGLERLLGIRQNAASMPLPRAALPTSSSQPQGRQGAAAAANNTAGSPLARIGGNMAARPTPAAPQPPRQPQPPPQQPRGPAAPLLVPMPPMDVFTQASVTEYIRSAMRMDGLGEAVEGNGAGAGPPGNQADVNLNVELERLLNGLGGSQNIAEQMELLRRTAPNQFQPEDSSRVVQWMLDRNLLEEDGMDQSFKSSMEIQWWSGAVDTRQRWRLCDPSLLPQRDDNRREFIANATRRQWSLSVHQVSLSEFLSANTRLNQQLFEALPQVREIAGLDVYGVQRIVESQSEVLFLLNMLLSTFYFSDAWRLLRDCRWVPRSAPMMAAAFGLDPTLPALVDVPPHVNLSEEVRSLPRFLSPLSANPHVSCGATAAAKSVALSFPPYPKNWRIVPFLELLGDNASTYLKDPNQMTEEELDNHQHGPDTMRKMELLRGLYEYCNAQDRTEQAMVVADEEVVASAARNAEAMAAVILRDREDSCVRIGLYQTLESYLRTFLYGIDDRDDPTSPQTTLGSMLMPAMLERVYNGTRISGLNGSMVPSKLQSNMFSLLGELVRYHGGNLKTLCTYVTGEVDLSHLNEAISNANRQNPVILSAVHEEVEEILKRPPLEREEHEPFGSVVLRRLLTFGVDTHLFLRSLLLSLTPGLRSRGNYLSKPVDDSIEDVRLPPAPPGIGRTSDIISGDAVRIAYIIRTSRQYAREISLAPKEGLQRTELLQELVQALARTPHRQPPEQRPFPSLFREASDTVLLQGRAALPPVGPPRRLRAPLFGRQRTCDAELTRIIDAQDESRSIEERTATAHREVFQNSVISDAKVLADMAPLARLLLSEPHKLVFSALCGLNIEAMEDNTRLSVVTTVLLVLLRVAIVGDGVPDAPPTCSADDAGLPRKAADAETGIRAVLDKMRPFAQHGYETWLSKEQDYRARQAEKRRAAALLAAAREGRHFRSLQEDDGVCMCDWRDTATSEEAEAETKLRSRVATLPDEGEEEEGSMTLDAPSIVPRNNKHNKNSNYDSIDFGVSPVVSRGVPAPDLLRWRCPGLMCYGCCDPPHEGSVYQREFGGCFYRSFFRLLCLWIGYYASCQRYVATVFFSTEVAFAEYKTVALFLLRILPDYFMPRYSEVMASS